MITTITLNPSVDKRYGVADIIKGKVIRAEQVENTAGGKGVNVSRVIRLCSSFGSRLAILQLCILEMAIKRAKGYKCYNR